MSHYVGLCMLLTGVVVLFALALKLLFQPFIPEEHSIHNYFPSTELVLGIPIFCGTLFFAGFGIYIFRILWKEN